MSRHRRLTLTLETITVHPADRAWFARQLPAAFLYGEPVPADTPVLHDFTVTPGHARIRINGVADEVPFAPSPWGGRGLQWSLPEPYPGWIDASKLEAT